MQYNSAMHREPTFKLIPCMSIISALETRSSVQVEYNLSFIKWNQIKVFSVDAIHTEPLSKSTSDSHLV